MSVETEGGRAVDSGPRLISYSTASMSPLILFAILGLAFGGRSTDATAIHCSWGKVSFVNRIFKDREVDWSAKQRHDCGFMTNN